MLHVEKIREQIKAAKSLAEAQLVAYYLLGYASEGEDEEGADDDQPFEASAIVPEQKGVPLDELHRKIRELEERKERANARLASCSPLKIPGLMIRPPKRRVDQ